MSISIQLIFLLYDKNKIMYTKKCGSHKLFYATFNMLSGTLKVMVFAKMA